MKLSWSRFSWLFLPFYFAVLQLTRRFIPPLYHLLQVINGLAFLISFLAIAYFILRFIVFNLTYNRKK